MSSSTVSLLLIVLFSVVTWVYAQQQHKPFSTHHSRPAKKVKVDIFYETDCPDSMNFIKNQLYPTYQELESIMQVRLVPFGKARETPNGRHPFACHHGPSECYGNTVQSCAIYMYPDTSEHLPFISCMESAKKPSQSGAKCSRRHHKDWEKIKDCVDSDAGTDLMRLNAKRTKDMMPNLRFVPWILLNEEQSDQNQQLALKNLKAAICLKYEGPEHPKCRGVFSDL